MKKTRLFIAFPITTSVSSVIKKIEYSISEKFKDLDSNSFRFIPISNLHITLTFLGYQEEISLPLISDAVEKTSKLFEPPEIIFDKIDYDSAFLNGKSNNVRMLWLHINKDSSKEISEIKNTMDSFLESSGISFQKEERLFSGHITLLRFGEKIDREKLPQIDKSVQLSYFPETINIMESELLKSGAKYNSLQEFNFID